MNVMNVTEETEGKGDYGIIVNVRVIVVNSVWLIHNLCAVRLKLHEYAKPSRRKGISNTKYVCVCVFCKRTRVNYNLIRKNFHWSL